MDLSQIKKDILKQENILSDDISSDDFDLDRFSQALSFPGNFAVIFPVKKRNKKYALRVSRTHLKSNNDSVKYNLISDYFKKNINPYKTFCAFKYIDRAIKSQGKVYPAILMDWVDGKNLFNYVNENYKNSNLMSDLADNFLKLFKRFHKLGISHGDLHNSNILINDLGRIKLIDYDSVYVKDFIELKHSIKGIESFVHPNKKKFLKEKQDFFPELIIYLSLLAISASPSLWEKYNRGLDNLIFTLKDFKNYENSDLFKSLGLLNDNKISSLVYILKKYLDTKDPYELIPIEEELSSLKNPVLSFSSNKRFVKNTSDKKIQLKWNAKSFKSVKLNIIDEDLSISGNHEIEINKAIRVTLSATTYTGEIKEKHINIEIDETPPEITKFVSSKKMLVDASPSIFSWEIDGASVVKIYNKSKSERIFNLFKSDLSLSDSIEIWNKEETIFRIEAISFFGVKSQKEITLKVSKKEPSINLSLSKYVLTDKIPSILNWDVSGAMHVEIDGEKIKNFKKSKSVWFDHDRKIVLKAESWFGVYSESEIELKVTRDCPKIIRFESVNYAPPNSEIILSWEVENRDTTVEISKIGNVPSKGQKKLPFYGKIIYSITATDTFNNKSIKDFAINEIRPPSINLNIPSPTLIIDRPKKQIVNADIFHFFNQRHQSQHFNEKFLLNYHSLKKHLKIMLIDANKTLSNIQMKTNKSLTEILKKVKIK